MSAAYDFASYLATLGYGTVGTSIRVNFIADSPDNQISVYEYGGAQSGLGHGNPDADALEQVFLQVRVRNLSAATAQSTAYAIYKAIDGKGGVTVGAVEYLYFKALQAPYLLERDETTVTFIFNVEIQKRRS
jgi:hypothetical protein